MKLRTREVIEKLIRGEKLCAASGYPKHYCYYDTEFENPFRFVNVATKSNNAMHGVWSETEWEVYKEEPKWWTPENGEKAWFVTLEGHIAYSVISEDIIKQGNVFKTPEEAKREVSLRAAKYRVKKRIWELNGGEFSKNNYTFALITDTSLDSIWFANKVCPNWQLLKSSELVEQLIEEMREDLLLIRGE